MNEPLDNSKTVAIVAHITLIGWIVAVVLNSQQKTELGSFYIRQVLGLYLMSLTAFIPLLGWIAVFMAFILWIVSLINAINGNKTPVPIVGNLFQDWFKGM